MFKFGFFSTLKEAQTDDVVPASETNDVNVSPFAPLTAEGDTTTRHVARREKPGGNIGAKVPEDAEGQVAWQAGDLTLMRVVPTCNVCPAAPEESDLVPGVYEGGLKVWEASLDLVEHIVAVGIGAAGRRRVHSEPRNDQLVRGEEEGDVSPVGGAGGDDENARSKSSLEQHEGYGEGKKAEEESDEVMPTGRRKQVLELGCGHGFPGIIALQQGMQVCFSDFNSEVIDQVTVPNVHLNVEERYWHLAEYYSGDWSSLSSLLDDRNEGGRFDFIFTAETLYTTAVADKVLDMILKHLACDGQAFVASKRFYFGTGGSTKHFRDRAAADGRLICVNEVVIDTGKGNIREVLRVSWR